MGSSMYSSEVLTTNGFLVLRNRLMLVCTKMSLCNNFVSSQVDEKLTVPHGTLALHRHHYGMPLTMSTSSLYYPLSSLQLFPNQTVDITCLSTIPGYNTQGEGFADAQNHTVAGKNFNLLLLAYAFFYFHFIHIFTFF